MTLLPGGNVTYLVILIESNHKGLLALEGLDRMLISGCNNSFLCRKETDKWMFAM